MRGVCGLAFLIAALVWPGPLRAAAPQPPSATLLVDAKTGAVLKAENATHPWYPASLTKVMTAYMVFQALADGRLTLSRKVTISARAAGQPPSRLGLRAGSKVTVKTLLEGMIVRSANDAAVALAEAIGGSENQFAVAMTRQARALGMTQSVFVNASGLPDPAQVTSARDLAILARAVIAQFPDRYPLFSKTAVAFNRQVRPTILAWMRGYDGAEGLKTGFTCGSGYNLLGAASRDGRRLIGVVLGAPTGNARNARMTRLMDAGFAMGPSATSGAMLLTGLRSQARVAAPYVLAQGRCPVAPSRAVASFPDRHLPGWGVAFGAFVTRAKASATLNRNLDALGDVVAHGHPTILAKPGQNPPSYSALLVGLEEGDAGEACRHLRSLDIYCLAVPPKLLNNPQALWR